MINARWAKPLDEALIAEHAAGKRLVVTAEESAAMGGFGDGVLDALNRAGAARAASTRWRWPRASCITVRSTTFGASSGSTRPGSWPRSARRSASSETAPKRRPKVSAA